MITKNINQESENSLTSIEKYKDLELNELRARTARTEAALRATQDELDIIFNNTDRAIRVINKNFTIRCVNQAFGDLFGIDPEQARGRKCWEVYPGPFCHTPNCCLKNHANGKELVKLEMSKPRGGRTRITCVHTSAPLRTPDGELVGVIETFRDITEREEANAKYRAILETTADGFWISDSEGCLLEFNDSLCKILGYTPEELSKMSVFDVLSMEKTENVGQYLSQVREQGYIYFETQCKCRDGRIIDIEISANYLQLGKGQIFALIRDITHRKRADSELEEYRSRLEEQVKKRTKELDEQIKRRTEYTRALVHELRTPLTAIISSSEMLGTSDLEDEVRQRLARNIFRGACNLNKRIDELLDLARSEIGVLKIRYKSLNPLKLIHEVAEDMSLAASRKGQTLILEAPKHLPSIWADKERLQQILLNLISNAIKFNRKRGRVILRASEKDTSIIFEVQDEGKGISSEDLKRLFVPYYRLESDRERLSGLGLGLTLCKELVELHEGKIWIKSKEGKGSTFSFSIPLGDRSKTRKSR